MRTARGKSIPRPYANAQCQGEDLDRDQGFVRRVDQNRVHNLEAYVVERCELCAARASTVDTPCRSVATAYMTARQRWLAGVGQVAVPMRAQKLRTKLAWIDEVHN